MDLKEVNLLSKEIRNKYFELEKRGTWFCLVGRRRCVGILD